MKLSLKPKQARVRCGTQAWWYDERNGISVYIVVGNMSGSCVIKRSALERYLKRSKR